MQNQLQHRVDLRVARGQVVGRRDFLKAVSVAGLAGGTLGFSDLVGLQADELRSRGMACIVLWMQGGSIQFDTFSPKPNHENGGETKAISTSVPGIQIADRFPHVAQVMDDVAILRSLTTKEGNHQRASFLMHTGYVPNASVKHPALGSILAHEIGAPTCELPSFVRVGGRFRNSGGGGLLGVEYDPFELNSAVNMPANTKPTTAKDRYQRRLGLLGRLESDYQQTVGGTFVKDHRALYEKTSRMILSSQMKAFDVNQESDETRAAYGTGAFGTGCLLARRLVEAGVTCVEVSAGNWDTHFDNFARTSDLAGEVDQPMAQLITDLKQRGMLDNTLVVWMGEFGRTPRVNPRDGRDHYPKAFNAAVAGGGIRGGQVIGATDEAGTAVTDRPIAVTDLFQTFCRSLRIDADVENMSPIGRPIRIVDGGAPVEELFT